MFDTVRRDIEANMRRAVVECVPGLADRMQQARREAPFKGADFPFFFPKPYGPGWALVGDAGYHRDAITGQGTTDAFRDADLLAAAVDAGLSRRHVLQDALEDYEQQRNAAVMPMYDFTYKLAMLEPPSEQEQQLFGALRTNQYEAERFLSLIAGMVAIPEFFADTERIIREAMPLAA
jgi:2-polyprenyl-6-methoxyphenol hydroxylase-like FAD-dependent oxidoreductase